MNKIVGEYFDYELRAGFVEVRYKVKLITLDIAKESVRIRKEISRGNSYPVLVKGALVSKFDKESRDYLSSEEATDGVLAGGILVRSVFQATLVNFFLKVTRPKIPAKLFTKEEDIINWFDELGLREK